MNFIKKIAKAELIGRGCNSFPTAKKWEIVRDASAKEKFVICNCSESEPGVFKDEYILKNYAQEVIDGIILGMKNVKAKKGFIYINPEYFTEFQQKLYNIIRNKKVNIEVYSKPFHDYIGGEETAVINSMSGWRVEPRLKPPFPTNDGFQNKPTLVNNCETFLMVARIKSGKYKKTRFYCVSNYENSKFENKVVKELPIDLTVKEVLEKFNHQLSDKNFYQVGGGASGNIYNWKQLNRNFNNNLASIIIYDKNIPEKDLILHWAKFFEDESCGQCVPCREGTFRVREILEQKYLSNKFDEKIFNELVLTLQESSLCPLGKVSTNSILSYWKNVKKVKNEKLKTKSE
jgi:NADH:ubiquinone oxidoreductase subunit F (NADH-binding)